MGVTYKSIRTQRQWRAATGLTEKQFHKLVPLYGAAYEELHETSLQQELELRSDEAKFTSYEEILFFVLYSLKSGLTYDLLALSFDMAISLAFEKQAAGVRILAMALQRNGSAPMREFTDFEHLEKYLDGYDELLIDGTE